MKRTSAVFLSIMLLILAGCLFVAAKEQTRTADSAETMTLETQWTAWKHKEAFRSSVGEQKYSKAFRQFYATDPEVVIDNHLVFVKETLTAENGSKEVLRLVDFFDSDAAERKTTTLEIPAEIGGVPLEFSMYSLQAAAEEPNAGGFQNNTVKRLALSGNWTEIQPFAFSGFNALETVLLPDSVVTIGMGAFQNCKKLKTVSGADELSSVDKAAFLNCPELKEFPAISRVSFFGSSCFSNTGFRSLTLASNIVFHDSLQRQGPGERQFAACGALKTVRFSTPVRSDAQLLLATEMFRSCGQLEKIVFPEKGKVVAAPMAFRNCTSLKTVQHSERIVSIHRQAFRNCKALQRITLGVGLQFAKWDSFKDCNGLKQLKLVSKSRSLFNSTSDLQGYSGYPNNDSNCNFVKRLPKTCTILVPNKTMKRAVQDKGFPGVVKIEVDVPAPKRMKATVENGIVSLRWSAVKNADGYRVYGYSEKEQKYQLLKELPADIHLLRTTSSLNRFCVRAFRVIDRDVSLSVRTTVTI